MEFVLGIAFGIVAAKWWQVLILCGAAGVGRAFELWRTLRKVKAGGGDLPEGYNTGAVYFTQTISTFIESAFWAFAVYLFRIYLLP